MVIVGPRLAAGLLAGMVLLAGCGGSPEPKALPAPRPSSSPSPTPAAVAPPVMPEAAKAKTRAGAIAEVHFFFNAMEYAGRTGVTSTFRRTYSSECTRCEAIADGIDKTYANGGSIEGGAWRPTKLKFYKIESDIAYIDATVDYDAQTWFKDASGTKVSSPAETDVLKAFQLRWRGGGWRVGALDPML